MDTLKDGTHTCALVINKKYEIVHYNQTIQRFYPEVHKGDLCYQALCGERVPCRECPISKDEEHVNAVIYNGKSKTWMEVMASPVDLPDEGSCDVVIARHMGEEQHKKQPYVSEEEKERSPLTGLYKKEVFFRFVEDFLSREPEGRYCLVAIDIEHFKLFNEWYGEDAGDRFLSNIGRQLLRFKAESQGIIGYMGADDFCVFLPDEPEAVEGLQKRIMTYVGQYGGEIGFLPAFGIYEIRDRKIPVSMMYDRASIAVASVKGNYVRRDSRYDSVMMQQMEEKHMLLSEVQQGLTKEEFAVYFQPKCNMATGKIVGAEALVRWHHPEKGVILPGGFVPLLEKSGFIARLDCYLWERVCRCLRRWLDAGLKPMPVSVNVSRVDIYTIDVVEHIKALTKQYELPCSLLEIEITESAYAEDDQTVIQVADTLRSAGYTVLMDDFGSGYSSLNILKDINVDILKIDMKFLAMDEHSAGKGLGILEAITGMAKLIGMRMIAEGVETQEQVKLLLDMNCLYGQGYYFYRPLSESTYEELMKDAENFDYRGIKAKKIQNISIKELLDEGVFSDTVMHKLLGGIGFYRVKDDNVELLQVNEQYYKVTGANPIDLEEKRTKILDEIYEEDQEKVLAIFRQADKDAVNGGEGYIRRKYQGSLIWIRLRTFFMKEMDGARLYYGAVNNVTDQLRGTTFLDKRKEPQHV